MVSNQPTPSANPMHVPSLKQYQNRLPLPCPNSNSKKHYAIFKRFLPKASHPNLIPTLPPILLPQRPIISPSPLIPTPTCTPTRPPCRTVLLILLANPIQRMRLRRSDIRIPSTPRRQRRPIRIHRARRPHRPRRHKHRVRHGKLPRILLLHRRIRHMPRARRGIRRMRRRSTVIRKRGWRAGSSRVAVGLGGGDGRGEARLKGLGGLVQGFEAAARGGFGGADGVFEIAGAGALAGVGAAAAEEEEGEGEEGEENGGTAEAAAYDGAETV